MMAEGMRPSGVEWIGDIPVSWKMGRLRYLASFESGATPSKDISDFWDGEIPWVSSQEVKTDVLTDTSLHISVKAVESCSTRLLPEGTVVMVARSGILQHTLPVALLACPMTVNQDIKALTFNDQVLGKFFLYFVKGNNDNLLKVLLKDKSTVDNISFDYLLSLRVPVPPIEEQERITKYLDTFCKSVEFCIGSIERQIDLLERYRSSVIHEAVTKGLDSNVPMKPSGAEWVHSVPESWRVEPLKYHCSMFKGLPILKTDLVEEGVPVISYGQIHSKDNTGAHLDDSLLRFIPANRVSGSESSKLQRGDVVFADTSEDVEGIGNAALIDTDDVVYAGYHTVTCRSDQTSLSGRYLAYLARTDAWRFQLRNLAMGVKVFSITQAILRKAEVLLPPRDEQERIADFLDDRCSAIDAVINTKRKQLDVLKKRRQSLIYEYVTGKRRVGTKG